MHQDASFELSNTAFGQFVMMRGDPFDLGGSKSYPTWKKGEEKKILIFFQMRMQNGTRKWVVEVLSSHVVFQGHSSVCGDNRTRVPESLPHALGTCHGDSQTFAVLECRFIPTNSSRPTRVTQRLRQDGQ